MRAVLDIHDPVSRQSLERFLVLRGWEVHDITTDPPPNGESSLVVVQETPAGTGSATCRSVRQSTPGRSVYVIGIVWQHDNAAIRRLAAAGVDDIMAAPFDADEVENRLTLAEARLGSPRPGANLSADASHDDLSEITRRLHVQQAFLEALFENAPEAVVILDDASRVARINGEFTRLFGFTPDEAHGRRLHEMIAPKGRGGEWFEFARGIEPGERVFAETGRRHRDGHLIDVSVLATPIDVNGPAGAFAIYRDITRRKRQEAALRESEARYRTLFDRSPVGFFLCDPTLRITHCNEYLCRLLEAAEDEIVGTALPALREVLDHALCAICGEAVGIMGAVLELTRDYVRTRNQFGRAIGDNQVIQHRLADMFGATEEARALTDLTAMRLAEGDPRASALVAAMAAKVLACARFVGEQGIQLHGGIGMTDAYPVGHYYKRLLTLEGVFGGAAHHLGRYAARM